MLIKPSDLDLWKTSIKIRIDIFIEEFKYPIEGEIDKYDESTDNNNNNTKIFGLLL